MKTKKGRFKIKGEMTTQKTANETKPKNIQKNEQHFLRNYYNVILVKLAS